jgi:transcriptional regulator with XRE-family HTH domain
MDTTGDLMAPRKPVAKTAFSKAKLRQLREAKEMTQLQVAVATGNTPGTVYTWEAEGKSVPHADELPGLARVLGCSIDDLFE